MAIKKYYDTDCNLSLLDGKTVAVIGFGSQGHAHSENLAESGVNVVVGLRKGSSHWAKAEEFAATCPNFRVMEVEEAAKAGDIVMMLVPDELCADIYNTQVAPYMTEGKALAFAHGFNIHFKTITPPKNVDVIMIAPKGPGHIVRRLYTEGEGCPSLICVEQDYTGKAKEIALSMYNRGADFVQHIAGASGMGVFTAAKEADRYAFGVGGNQNYIEPDYIVATALRDVNTIVYNEIKALVEGTWEPGVHISGIAEGSVGFDNTDSNVVLPDDIAAAVEDIKAKITAGELVPCETAEELDAWVAANQYQPAE